jgi:hypothetical protein
MFTRHDTDADDKAGRLKALATVRPGGFGKKWPQFSSVYNIGRPLSTIFSSRIFKPIDWFIITSKFSHFGTNYSYLFCPILSR